MKQNKLFFLILITFLVLPLISAERIDNPLSISVQCTNSTYSNISYVKYVLDSVYLIDTETAMVKQGNFYNHTIAAEKINQTGTLEYGYHCDLNGDDTSAGNTVFVSLMGEELTEGQGLLYIVIFISLIIILAGTIYFASIIPFKNGRSDEDGRILTINDFKYVKIVLWVFAYLEMLFIVLILKNLTGYLLIEGTHSFFNVLFWFMLVALAPFFPVLIYFTVVLWISDKNLQRKITRGLPVY